ncbi:queuine tRNA-ribosyltransferase [[Clostridium] saccharolyticum WM1]|uniref:Queuine tRNA-ribosyltransferase n=2 Tax=Lacrimispora TaxID=2719231 RepID=D9R4P6_LACSW|nr:queuine tRNA-ribosyltransferase [[Clostridium] saccharolyticum WM1]
MPGRPGQEKEMQMNYKIIARDGRAKRGSVTTVHGTVQTPVFMNVGTVGAIKGAVSTDDLREIKTQVELSNTYHLHVRTGDKLIKEFGGLHRFMNWDRPILTDSGGFQVFSLTGLRKIKEEGVYFQSHIDGHRIFMGPEESMQIQSNLASTIAMAFDECPPHPATREYMQNSVDRTTRWLERCRNEMARLNSLPDTLNKEQLLFGINQGGTFEDIRIAHAKTISAMDLDGYALGGLAVGESHEEMYRILEETVPYLPENKPTYLMGVGTPANILESVDRGVDFFDCVYPSRNGRHGHVYTNHGKMNLFNIKYELDHKPIEEGCGCPACRSYSRAYIRHLLKAKEMLGMRLCVLHNLYFYNTMMEEIRDAIENHRYGEYKEQKLDRMMAGQTS